MLELHGVGYPELATSPRLKRYALLFDSIYIPTLESMLALPEIHQQVPPQTISDIDFLQERGFIKNATAGDSLAAMQQQTIDRSLPYLEHFIEDVGAFVATINDNSPKADKIDH